MAIGPTRMKKLFWLLLFAPVLYAQTGVVPFRTPRATFTDPNGVPLANGCVFTYQGGTTTPQATYTDYTGSTPNTNPVILDSTGSAVMWLSGTNTYKFVAWSYGGTNCASGVQQWSVDQVPGNAVLNGTISGATITGGTIAGAAISGGTLTGAALTTDTIDSTAIGQTTPAAGAFTSVTSGLDAVTFSATPTFNASAYGIFSMSLTGNVTSSTLTGGQIGQEIAFNICQSGSGGYTFAWPTNMPNIPIGPNFGTCTVVSVYNIGGAWDLLYDSPTVVTGGIYYPTFSTTPVFPANASSAFSLTLTANVTSSTITGGLQGQFADFNICQNATGGYTFVWPTNVLNAPTIAAAANACTGVSAFSDGTNWHTVGYTIPASISVGAQTVILGSNFTTASTSLVSTGLVLPSIAASTTVRGTCNLVWSQSTAAQAIAFGIGMSTAPSSMIVFAQNPIATATTPTTFTGTTPASVGTITPGGAGIIYTERLDFSLTTSTTASVLTIYGNTSNAADSLVVYAGSSCGWLP